MAFDTSELDKACTASDFTDEAYWPPENPTSIPVIFDRGPEYDDDEGVKVNVGDKITAGTLETHVVGMKRGDLIKIHNVIHKVLGFEPDGYGWVDLVLVIAP